MRQPLVFLVVASAMGLSLSCKPRSMPTTTLKDATSEVEQADGMLVDFSKPGPNLPPRGRSLFDMLTASGKEQRVPYPLPKLMELIAEHAPGFRIMRDGQPHEVAPYFTLLVPKGRSIQKSKVDAAHPRVLIAATGGVRQDKATLGINYKQRLFIGYAEKAETLEIISYNPDAGRYEFQVVKDYAAGKTPKVYYANRALCVSCHHSQGPLFSKTPWSETNGFPDTLAALKAALPGQQTYHGAPIEPAEGESRQGPAAAMEHAVTTGNELLDALALYQRFRPVCPNGLAEADCNVLKEHWAPERFRAELHLAAYEDVCRDVSMYGSARLDALEPLQIAFVRADFPKPPRRPSELVDDLVPRFGNVENHLQTAIIDPTRSRPFPPIMRTFGAHVDALVDVVKPLAEEYKPNCHHLQSIPVAKLEQAYRKVAEQSRKGLNPVFRQAGFNTNNVIVAVIKEAGGGTVPANAERVADELPLRVLMAMETDVALPPISEPNPLMFVKHCGECHGANTDMPLFEGDAETIRRALQEPTLAKEVYRRLNWEDSADGMMPPEGSSQRVELNKTNHRQEMLRLVETAARTQP